MADLKPVTADSADTRVIRQETGDEMAYTVLKVDGTVCQAYGQYNSLFCGGLNRPAQRI